MRRSATFGASWTAISRSCSRARLTTATATLLDLEKQRADHQDYLRSLDVRTVGDRDQFQRCRDALERDLNRNLQEQAALEQRADRHTFREE